ncbi:hypothetical protein MPDQ_000774 [Monascus purpureus]|uniref:glucan endo-1,3-beta-D-glucosidase n=1 Tax=Monascus purpureus TaxID=5098 RepID=A0A507QP17_MONPU|nr:hypothetical protein MPDQ_000774 [Monascus purpureus]BDD59580.1 hypothetical protein MAP00_004775 [Monascus purpureus]
MTGAHRALGFDSAHEDMAQHADSVRANSTVTPGMDDLGSSAVGGGISGIALGVANTHSRESGIEAVTNTSAGNTGFDAPAERDFHTTGSDNPYIPSAPGAESSDTLRPRDSYGSNVPLGAGSFSGQLAPGSSPRFAPSTPSRSIPYQSPAVSQDGPYQRNSFYNPGGDSLDIINPDDIADDGDDGFTHSAAAGAGAGGLRRSIGAFMRGQKSANASELAYDPVPGGKKQYPYNEGKRNRRMGLFVGIFLALVIVGAIVGGVVGGVVGDRGNKDRTSVNSSGSTSSSGSSDTGSDDGSDDGNGSNGDLDKNSPEIKALMNNTNLHKVFPGVDYTPWGVQYPLCLKYPPSQNNVTRDMAVLSQLTNNVRLYGTDCNQTEMVLHAIDRLELTDMKLWLGVWLDTNTTTNERQLEQLYKVIDNTKDTSIFNGAIIGNEALYRAGPDIATAEKNLIAYMKSVRANFTQRNLDLPVATSDLGDNWNSELVQVTDFVMSNVHPFFAGVTVDIAANWTWDFWQQHDVSLTQGTTKKQVISEVGWPTGGGNDCGSNNDCPNPTAGSVAGIDELNQFMSEWVCQALENGTDYFWFEAFDEPWKVIYNTPGKEWEDKWGLMDSARKLKPGVKIPDCGGKTAS